MERVRCIFCKGFLKGAKVQCPVCGKFIQDVMKNDPQEMEDFVEDIMRDRVDSGGRRERIAEDLIDMGFERSFFEARLNDLADGVQRDVRKEGLKQMFIGLGVAFVGILITVGTYIMASERGGGYLVTYGIILVGLVLAAKGAYGALHRS